MSLRFPRRLPFCLLLLMGTAPVWAQTPEGPQLPPPDDRIGVVHGQVRLGEYAVTHRYKYQGEYEAGINLIRVAISPVYVFGDVDVEGFDSHHTYKPDRLVGTFEAGARRLFGVTPLSVLVRHESAHYIDRDDLFQGSWDMAGVRWQQAVGTTQLSATLAQYLHVHQVAGNYTYDGDLQGVTPLTSFLGHHLALTTDLHAATGTGGYVDYWVEPDLTLSAQAIAFLGYGQIHDTNLSAANVDHALIAGVRLGF